MLHELNNGVYLWPSSVKFISCNRDVPGLIQVDTFITSSPFFSPGAVELSNKGHYGKEKKHYEAEQLSDIVHHVI